MHDPIKNLVSIIPLSKWISQSYQAFFSSTHQEEYVDTPKGRNLENVRADKNCAFLHVLIN